MICSKCSERKSASTLNCSRSQTASRAPMTTYAGLLLSSAVHTERVDASQQDAMRLDAFGVNGTLFICQSGKTVCYFVVNPTRELAAYRSGSMIFLKMRPRKLSGREPRRDRLLERVSPPHWGVLSGLCCHPALYYASFYGNFNISVKITSILASASYVLASASQKIFVLGLGLTLSGLGLGLGLILLWPH